MKKHFLSLYKSWKRAILVAAVFSTYLRVKLKYPVCELLHFILRRIAAPRHIRVVMAGKDIMLERFSGHIARDWTDWLQDYECYADMKKWNEARHIQKIKFFISG